MELVEAGFKLTRRESGLMLAAATTESRSTSVQGTGQDLPTHPDVTFYLAHGKYNSSQAFDGRRPELQKVSTNIVTPDCRNPNNPKLSEWIEDQLHALRPLKGRVVATLYSLAVPTFLTLLTYHAYELDPEMLERLKVVVIAGGLNGSTEAFYPWLAQSEAKAKLPHILKDKVWQFHGDKDGTVTLDQAKDLAVRFEWPARLDVMPNHDHVSVFNDKKPWDKVIELAQST